MGTVVAFLLRVVVMAVALWVATLIVPGIDISAGTPGAQVGTLVGVALIFGLVNATLKRLIRFVGFCLYIITLGLIGLVVNALLFELVGWLAGGLGLPFTVDGFGSAFLGAIVVAVVGAVLHLVIPDRLDRR
jgi:putative membrane protein